MTFQEKSQAFTLKASDALAIHWAIHTKPLPQLVKTSAGVFSLEPNKYGNASVLLQSPSCRFVGANPKKDSAYGKKMRAGGSVTLINPGSGKGWENRCVVLESRMPGGATTITKNNTNLVLDDSIMEPLLPRNDPSRVLSIEEAEQQQDMAVPVMKKARGHGKAVTHVERAKSGRAACKICEAKISQSNLRFGIEYNYKGAAAVKWAHASCLVETMENHEKAEFREWKMAFEMSALDELEGWNGLQNDEREQLCKLFGVSCLSSGGAGNKQYSEVTIVD
mmetsp:Transcript_55563/g.92034  ORF Transcript_55563/g.92034 Transcript_55563/m.92034 type:complete len:279 (+) Transcript_55563:3-839(+)|eukprot:CAMPEP_0119333324 /NCGR_PEP_ID=MMETSP1333-20130426/84906_1 /TAXON_ID=418940 /ORGANISM="Scyphosphaera apsteinii, Strain RCC1455" /LENGTH=278 /DNA_ID=CAMNT_0007343367 /DNA_START=3 /DNA_END=839 /DNA_ORIENTATION=+